MLWIKDTAMRLCYAVTMKKEGISLSPQQTVAQALQAHPEFIPVFMRHRMICVGCYMAPFDTLEEAVQNYGLEWEAFKQELLATNNPNNLSAG